MRRADSPRRGTGLRPARLDRPGRDARAPLVFLLLALALTVSSARADIRVERVVSVGQNVPDGSGFLVNILNFANPGITNISDVDVRLVLSSPDGANPMWLGDLYSALTYGTASESERVSVLLNRPGVNNTDPFGSSLSSLDVWLDSSAATNVFFITNATGTYQADGRIGVDPYAYPHPAFNTNDVTAGLAALNGGMLASQQWNLLVADTEAGGVARLDAWRLAVTGGAATNGTLDAGPGGSITSLGGSNTLGAVVTVSGTGGNGITAVVTNGTLDFQTGLQGAGDFKKAGAGTLTISGASAGFTGAVDVQSGTANLDAAGGGALGVAAAIAVQSGAKLLVSQSGQVNDAAAITLSGGTIQRAGGVSEVFGALNLTAASAIDFGTGAAGTLEFGAYEGNATPDRVLTVDNFLAGNVLIFGSDLSAFVAATYSGTSFTSTWFTIHSASGGFTSAWNGGQFTITAVPEPSAALAAAALAGLLLISVRRSLRPAERPLD